MNSLLSAKSWDPFRIRGLGGIFEGMGWCLGGLLFAMGTVACGGESTLLGFWSFSEGAPGTECGVIRNTDGSGTYVGQAAMTSPNAGKLPEFSDWKPGNRLAASSFSTNFYTDFQSLKFTYNDHAESNAELNGGFVSIPDLANDLAGLEGWTIEYFLRLDDDWKYESPHNGNPWERISKTALYMGGYDGGFKMIAPGAGSPQGVGRQLSLQKFLGPSTTNDIVTAGAVLSDRAWHHTAAVFTATNGTVGKLTLFFDYQEIGSLAFDNQKVASRNDEFIVGTGARAKRSTERFRGYISALRVSSSSNGVDDFLRPIPDAVFNPELEGKETVGFWEFKDGVPGSTAACVTNRIAPEIFVGTGTSLPDGPFLTFDADHPGRYLFADGYGENLLAEGVQSLNVPAIPNGAANGRVCKMTFPDLGTALAFYQDYTVEFFVKSNSKEAYKNFFTLGLDPRTAMIFKMNYGSAKNLGVEILRYYSESNWKPLIPNKAAKIAMPDEKWHHVAVVHQGAENKYKIYFDYHHLFSLCYTNQPSIASIPVAFGTSIFPFKEYEAFTGKIASPRISQLSLAEEKFMVASDTVHRVDPNVIFAYSFDEGGSMDGEIITTVPGYPYGSLKGDWEYNYGGDESKPRYAVSGLPKYPLVLWNRRSVSTNTACISFHGYHAATAAPENLRHYAGTAFRREGATSPRQNPKSWTMEAFVKARYPSFGHFNGALIFGKCGNTDPQNLEENRGKPNLLPRYCWLLTRMENGNLKIFATEADGSENGKSTGVEISDSKILDDGEWHHLALTYDQPTRTFGLYADYQLIGERTLTHELFDGPYEYNFSRHSDTASFEGWMDEIRFSNVVQEPKNMVHYAPLQRGLLIILR